MKKGLRQCPPAGLRTRHQTEPRPYEEGIKTLAARNNAFMCVTEPRPYEEGIKTHAVALIA